MSILINSYYSLFRLTCAAQQQNRSTDFQPNKLWNFSFFSHFNENRWKIQHISCSIISTPPYYYDLLVFIRSEKQNYSLNPRSTFDKIFSNVFLFFSSPVSWSINPSIYFGNSRKVFSTHKKGKFIVFFFLRLLQFVVVFLYSSRPLCNVVVFLLILF